MILKKTEFTSASIPSSASESHKKDLELISQTLNGSSQAFAQLVSLYKNRVQALGMSFFHNSTETDDFVQDVFIKAYTNLSSFRGESRFSTWLTRIAYTTALNAINSNKEFTSLSVSDQDNLVYAGKTPEEAHMHQVTVQAVKEAVMELPGNYSICLDLYFFHDLSYEEISVITEFPVNTIKSHVFRAKKLLREKLKDFGN